VGTFRLADLGNEIERHPNQSIDCAREFILSIAMGLPRDAIPSFGKSAIQWNVAGGRGYRTLGLGGSPAPCRYEKKSLARWIPAGVCNESCTRTQSRQ
jgi:hypothetical protein